MNETREQLERLWASAEERVHGHDANRMLFEARQSLQKTHGRAWAYEMVLSPDGAFRDLVDRHLPKLAQHYIAKNETLPGGPHVLLAVWHDDHVARFAPEGFFSAIAEIEGLPVELILQRMRFPDLLALPVPPE